MNDEVSENEAWYDEEVAPKLAELANQCGERKISFLSIVEYNPGDRARTQRLEPNAGLEMIMCALCAISVPNIDRYLLNLIRYCNEKNIDLSESIFLNKYASPIKE